MRRKRALGEKKKRKPTVVVSFHLTPSPWNGLFVSVPSFSRFLGRASSLHQRPPSVFAAFQNPDLISLSVLRSVWRAAEGTSESLNAGTKSWSERGGGGVLQPHAPSSRVEWNHSSQPGWCHLTAPGTAAPDSGVWPWWRTEQDGWTCSRDSRSGGPAAYWGFLLNFNGDEQLLMSKAHVKNGDKQP